MISLEEMRVLDRNLEYHGVSIEELMELAGKGIAETLLEKMQAGGKKVLFFCGTGNNAGDGFVAARYLEERAKVTVALAKPSDQIWRGPAKKNFQRIPSDVRVLEPPPDYDLLAREADILVDGLLGTGLEGSLREPYRSMVEAMNASERPILSIDLPSGMGSDTVVRPQFTVALHAVKEGMNEALCGEIVVVDIGITHEYERLVGPGEFFYYPEPGLDAHKGDSGRVLVVAGGPYTGAPALAGLAAYRIGSDVVHVVTPSISHPVVASFSPTLIVHGLPGEKLIPRNLPRVLELAAGKDAVVIGPGLGRAPETLATVRDLIRGLEGPVVIDADGITAVAEDRSCLQGKRGVITPHKMEFYRLSAEELSEDFEERIGQVQSFAAKLGFTVLLKGHHDIISDGENIRVNQTGNPAMSVGGTGDVLAGLVGGLLGKGLSPFKAARLAAFASGYAGDIAFRELSYGMMATDVLDKIPAVLIEFL
ncbi:MAG: NAD(P)H-hydrate dehydratase [Thermoplasmata archaeon]